MSDLKLRSGQLIVPFGIGQIIPNEDGLSMMLGGLNLWDDSISQRKQEGATIEEKEFEISDKRLKKLLKVKKFVSPFPYYDKQYVNNRLSLPAVVFPLWHYCSYCGTMQQSGISDVNRYCIETNCIGKRNKMIPVRFVAACDDGHIQDVPFIEWIHRDGICNSPKLKFNTGGGSGELSGIWINCENCDSGQNLGGLLKVEHNEENIITSSALDSVLDFKCKGHRPWIGEEGFEDSECSNHLQVIISGGSNVHYTNITSALKLPNIDEEARLIEYVKPQNLEGMLSLIGMDDDDLNLKIILENVKSIKEGKIKLNELYKLLISYSKNENEEDNYNEIDVRYEEFEHFKRNNNFKELKTIIQKIDPHNDDYYGLLKNIVLVNKLTETRVFNGFTRLSPINMMSLMDRKQFLSRHNNVDWLPAYQHYGEGIFLEFNIDNLNDFLIKNGNNHPRIIDYHNAQIRRNPNYEFRDIDKGFIIIHTLSHLLIKQLCFECGYGSSSLKERLYYSNNPETRMVGILIYTASGDSEGSLGGLVNQGKVEYFKKIFQKAIQEAEWCSSDPVCSDIGIEGQGPGNVNGAACHNCCILPETSCEEFNQLLDRNVVAGTMENGELGYFHNFEPRS